jgi:prophage maintenance system killer protein
MFCVLNGNDLEVPTEDAVSLMLGVAAGEIDEAAVAGWLPERLALNSPTEP